jgi:hypothetical protein
LRESDPRRRLRPGWEPENIRKGRGGKGPSPGPREAEKRSYWPTGTASITMPMLLAPELRQTSMTLMTSP